MTTPVNSARRRSRWIVGSLLALIALYLALLIPDTRLLRTTVAGQQAFRWNRDAFWSELETRFREAQKLTQEERLARFDAVFEQVHQALNRLAERKLSPDSPEFGAFEATFFELAPVAAVCPERLSSLQTAAGRIRQLVKWQSEGWPDSSETRHQLYRLLYGSRAAVEEVLLQVTQATNALELAQSYDHHQTPSAELLGVKTHSGDVLVSRGGAATSALIARGNDYPGNFSHIALVHVDEQSRKVSVIESHIESGVGVRPIEDYLAETKLRIMVLRLRGNLPVMVTDPLLPHRAASLAMSNSLVRHIPYDFAMEHADPGKQFCSEVATAAYQPFGVTLWMNLSQLSTPGVTSWLAALGVRNFESQEPSDLEYDPQLQVVAEWRDPETLLKDHVDNAVIDVMLEGAERGETLDYNLWMLPLARLAKAWSVVLNEFGKVGPIPEGMSATIALRAEHLTARHNVMSALVLQKAADFKREHGYTPPYWELVRMAREAVR